MGELVNSLRNDPKLSHEAAGKTHAAVVAKRTRDDLFAALVEIIGELAPSGIDTVLRKVEAKTGDVERSLAVAQMLNLGTKGFMDDRAVRNKPTQTTIQSCPQASYAADASHHPDVVKLIMDGAPSRAINEAMARVTAEQAADPALSTIGPGGVVEPTRPPQQRTTVTGSYNADEDSSAAAARVRSTTR